ncbi:tetratricopeptide repeat protein [Hydrogenophaga sp.]|uniref:tetratricopeptide repeat protein n=1 Tax=Hydrogenophaga sp. TaxID=1904254 RepID=UPI0025BD2652|nr:tetratricopeptide repeat protein [Hydrogenophaga sp.]
MKSITSILLLAAALAWSGAHAADTPSNLGPTVSERLTTARAAIAAKDWSRALSELNTAAREEPRNAEVHNLLGYSHRKQATPNLAKAFEHYRIALQIDPKHKGAHEYIGEAYLMNRQPAEAEKHLTTLEQLCGSQTCEEYADLARAIQDYRTKNPG